MTIIMWLCGGPGNNKHIFSNWEQVAGNTRAWLMSSQTDGAVRGLFSWDGTSFANLKTPTNVLDFSWKCVAWTFASGAFGLYLNGASASITTTTPWTGGSVAMFSANVRCMGGGHSPSAPPADTSMGGCHSNFMLVNKVLSASEITEHYNNGSPKDASSYSFSANITNQWAMDQRDSGSTIIDRVTSAANGTITTSGTTGYFAKSASYPTYNTDVGVANVLSTATYNYDGTPKTGTYVAVPAANVKSGVAFGPSSSLTGTLAGGSGHQHLGPGRLG